MTRDEMKKLFEISDGSDNSNLIDKIFDNLESRNCSNCKYTDDEYFDLFCINPDVVNQHDHLFGDGQPMYDNFKVSANFNCNKWESK